MADYKDINCKPIEPLVNVGDVVFAVSVELFEVPKHSSEKSNRIIADLILGSIYFMLVIYRLNSGKSRANLLKR